MPDSRRQVFLGGAAGGTTWRRDVAIPALEAAGVTYFDPQVGIGEWTEELEAAEMLAKDEAEVLLFVINGETRGVATIGEVAYSLGLGRPLALAITDLHDGAEIAGHALRTQERDDLNRGRIFVRTMARAHGVPVFMTVAEAVQHAIGLARSLQGPLRLDQIRAILAEIQFGPCRFSVEASGDGFLMQISAVEPDAATGMPELFTGRKWHLGAAVTRSEVVRTALKAALTWQEHETRERFTYRGKRVFGPHFDADRLAQILTFRD